MTIRFPCQNCGKPWKPIKHFGGSKDIDCGSRLRLCLDCEWEKINEAEAMNIPIDELWEMAG